jgi:hypothetical protein
MTERVPPDAIGDVVFDDEALAALPSWLARAAGARSATILWRHLDGVHEVMAFNRQPPACAALYAWKYAPIDPWVKAALAAVRPGEVLGMDERVPLAAFEKSRLHRELFRPWGDDTVHAAVAVFDTGSGDAIVSVYRGRQQGPFAQSDLDSLGAYLPDLGRALRTRGELMAYRRRERVRRDSLDGVGLASVVMRADGQVLRLNLAADQVLRRADGFCTRGGFVSCVDPGSRLRLQAALALATAPDNAMATAIPVERLIPSPQASQGQDRRLAYMVSVTPRPSEGDKPLAMLVFRDPDAAEDSLATRLRALFRPARAEIADLVGSPHGLAATANAGTIRA